MTAKQRPIPAHGTEARYKGRINLPGCRCQPCTRATSRAIEVRKLDRIEGNPRKVSPGPLIAHLAELHIDMTWCQIARAAGMAHTTPREIYIGRYDAVLRSTADRLLAVRPNHRPNLGCVNSLGATRRLRALYALAHAHKTLVARTGASSKGLENLLGGRYATVTVELDDAVRRVYSELCMKVGRSHKTLARARREGWMPPLAWDNIDDPNETPTSTEDSGAVDEVAVARFLAGGQAELNRAERIAVAQTLHVDHGVSLVETAERLGLNPRTVLRWKNDDWRVAA